MTLLHAHNRYFDRQTEKFEGIEATEKEIWKSRKAEDLAKTNLYNSIEDFKFENDMFKRMKMERRNQQDFVNRLIKNEVINMADQVEEVTRILMSQQDMIHEIHAKLNAHGGPNINDSVMSPIQLQPYMQTTSMEDENIANAVIKPMTVQMEDMEPNIETQR